MPLQFDILIIGAGQAAIPLALDLSKEGKEVAIVERDKLGGSCVNFGCTPTKAAIASSNLLHKARRGRDFGLLIGDAQPDFEAVIKRAKLIAEESRSSLEQQLSGKENPKLVRGHARILGRSNAGFTVDVEGEKLSSGQLVLDVGTRSFFPPIPGLMETKPIHAGNWLETIKLPPRLAVIGGGVVALEMAQFYSRMGSQVTVIERAGQIGGHEDEDVADELQKLLMREGVQFRLNATTESVEPGPPHRLSLRNPHGQEQIEADAIFVATGRKPNTDDLGLDSVGAKLEKGIIKVGPTLQAEGVTGLWVAGDARGNPMFTHTAWDDYRILKSQLIGDGSRTTDRIVPYAVFTDPQLGRVGLTERELREQKREYVCSRFEMFHNGMARESEEREGFIKVLADPESDEVLGAAILASDAAEMVHLYVVLMNAKAKVQVMRDAIIAHPTYSEAVQSAVEGLTPRE